MCSDVLLEKWRPPKSHQQKMEYIDFNYSNFVRRNYEERITLLSFKNVRKKKMHQETDENFFWKE